MYRRTSSVFLFSAFVAPLVFAELFSSTAHLNAALYAERDIAKVIREYVKVEESRLKRLTSVADDLDLHSAEALESKENVLFNPVNAYLYMKKFTLDWDKEVAPLFQRDSETEVNHKLVQLKSYLPSYEDLNGAVSALLRLQDTYKLDTDDLARGLVGSSRSHSMTAADCFEIGRQAYAQRDFLHCSMWMKVCLDVESLETNKTMERANILDYFAYSSLMQGDVRRALILTDELLTLAPHHTRAQNNRRYYEKILKSQDTDESNKKEDNSEDKELDKDYRQSDEFRNYEQLCRGEKTMVYKDSHKLVCRYRHNDNPVLLIQPAKEEEMYLDPWIVVYHDIMSDYEIETIKRIATPKLDRATVHNAKTGQLETANYRVSKSAWLKNGDDKVIQRVNNRIQQITGLSMDTAEDLQIANYGLGGHYEPHFDYARKTETEAFKSLGTGNRIATWLTYMTDVEAGGATVFPYIGVQLFPKKGAAAFWYNLYRNGDGIYNTRHAACPVLVGHKWVSNKWIHERGQEFRRPCGLNANE